MPDDQRVDFLKRGNETSQGIADTHAGLPPDSTGAIMSFNKFIQVCGGFPQADKSAMGTINRPLQMFLRCVRYPGYFVTVHNRGPTIHRDTCPPGRMPTNWPGARTKFFVALVFAFFLLLGCRVQLVLQDRVLDAGTHQAEQPGSGFQRDTGY